MSQLGVRHHRKRGRCFEGTEPHVYILEGKSGFETRIIEVICHVGIMLLQRFDLIKQGQIAQFEEVSRLAKIGLDQSLDAQMVMAVALLQVAQECLKTSRLDRFKLSLQGVKIRGQRQLAAIVEDEVVGRVEPAAGQANRAWTRPTQQIPLHTAGA